MPTEEIQSIIDPVVNNWVNAPEVVVIDHMDDHRTPEAARKDNKKLMSKG